MKKVFVVVMNYEEDTEDLFTDMGIEASLDNQLWELREKGHISSYDYTNAYEIKEEQQGKFIFLAEQHNKFPN